MLALIDGDRIIMGAGYGSQRMLDDGTLQIDPEEFAFFKAKQTINRILKDVETKDYKIYLGDPSIKHFRYSIAKTKPYKGNRKDTLRPAHEQVIRDYVFSRHPCVLVQGVEVDDALGMAQTEDTMICSNDKDLDMIPGWHYDIDWGVKRQGNVLKSYKRTNKYFITDPGFLSLRKKEKKSVVVGGGYYWFCLQMLTGDSTDNIPGLPKVGPVTAYSILKDVKSKEEAIKKVWEAYQKYLPDLTKDEQRTRIKEIARLCWIKREHKEKIFPGEWLE